MTPNDAVAFEEAKAALMKVSSRSALRWLIAYLIAYFLDYPQPAELPEQLRKD